MMEDIGRSGAEAPSGCEATPSAADASSQSRIPNAQAALNVRAGLFIDEGGHLYPVTNWFDADGDDCSREDAVTCVAGEGGCWFALRISDFEETGARA